MRNYSTPSTLRRTFTPSASTTIILACVVAGGCYVTYKSHDFSFLWVSLGIVALYGFYVVCFGLRYRVSYDGDAVTMRAAGGQRVVRYQDIAFVRYEVGVAVGRPFRRIVIAGRRHNYVDVSLRHFNLDDVEALLAAVHTRRPDLQFPTHWRPR